MAKIEGNLYKDHLHVADILHKIYDTEVVVGWKKMGYSISIFSVLSFQSYIYGFNSLNIECPIISPFPKLRGRDEEKRYSTIINHCVKELGMEWSDEYTSFITDAIAFRNAVNHRSGELQYDIERYEFPNFPEVPLLENANKKCKCHYKSVSSFIYKSRDSMNMKITSELSKIRDSIGVEHTANILNRRHNLNKIQPYFMCGKCINNF